MDDTLSPQLKPRGSRKPKRKGAAPNQLKIESLRTGENAMLRQSIDQLRSTFRRLAWPKLAWIGRQSKNRAWLACGDRTSRVAAHADGVGELPGDLNFQGSLSFDYVLRKWSVAP